MHGTNMKYVEIFYRMIYDHHSKVALSSAMWRCEVC